jgi:hypothetical protein
MAVAWQKHESAYKLHNAAGDVVSIIAYDGTGYRVKVKNRSGGWNYDSSPRVVGAMAKARKMLRRETNG